ncbi:hypothetical protein ACNUDN_03715 [Mycobacterium sp. smrl_JER01]
MADLRRTRLIADERVQEAVLTPVGAASCRPMCRSVAPLRLSFRPLVLGVR